MMNALTLYRSEQMPDVFKEIGIVKGYRNPSSHPIECLLSLFSPTNETLNIWTHLLPAWYFIYRLVKLSEEYDFINDPYTHPLLIIAICMCIYPLASAGAHVFNTMSFQARHICFFIDYASITTYSYGTALAYMAYALPESWINTSKPDYFLSIAFVNALICLSISCRSRLHRHVSFKSKFIRVAAFALPYFYDSGPIIYRLFTCESEKLGCLATGLVNIRYHGWLAFITAFFYSSHFPERFIPGKFDIVGHSHQLFHICSVIASYYQLEALIADMSERKLQLDSHTSFPSQIFTVYGTAALVIASIIIVVGFSVIITFNKRSKCDLNGNHHSNGYSHTEKKRR